MATPRTEPGIIAGLRQEVSRLEQDVVRAQHAANHDPLTGLPNRSLLRDRVGQALVRAAREHEQVAVLMIDLDGFKSVNDQLGHAAGDKVLQQVAERLRNSIRSADTASRYGGDEFIVLLPDVGSAGKAAELTRNLRAQLKRPWVIDSRTLAVTASVGVAVYPADGNNVNELIRQADIAMYHAKPQNQLPLRTFLLTERT